jgi:hypothetical protein
MSVLTCELERVVVIVVDAESSIFARSGVRLVRGNQSRLFRPLDLPSREPIGRVATYDGGGAKPSRHKRVWRIGRRVAILAAVMPIPGSTVDHMETSIVTSVRVSSWLVKIIDCTYTEIQDRW